MAGNLSNKPKILHGAFVEYGLTIPPLFVGFQFNPVELSRSRSLSFKAPNDKSKKGEKSGKASQDQGDPLRKYHAAKKSLSDIQKGQLVTVQEETISFDIRLDATDKLNEGDKVAGQFGIAPQLATLELMVLPKNESLLGGLVGELLELGSSLLSKGKKKKGKKKSKGFSFTKLPNPPLVLFIWGRKKVLPVNINSLSIKESELSPDLNPIRATVSVKLTVIEGKNSAYKYSKAMTETMSVANLSNVTDVVNVVIPL